MVNKSPSQKLILDMTRNAGRYNNFSGERVAADLEANHSLWPAVYFTEGDLFYDTLFLLPEVNAHDQLEQSVSGWNADDFSWWSFDYVARAMMVNKKHHAHLFPDTRRGVLYVWWD